MRINIFNTRITVTFWFAAVLAVMMLTDKSGLIIPTTFAVLMHETAHIVAMNFLGVAPKEIVLIPGSIQIFETGVSEIKTENAILLSGPLCNIVFFLIFYGLGFWLQKVRLMVYGAVQLVIGVFNLLPAKGLDGGSLIYNIVLKRKNVCGARTAVKLTSIFVVFCFVLVGTVMLLNGEVNISFYIIALYILIFSILKN